jgi:DNA topoisomerase-1
MSFRAASWWDARVTLDYEGQRFPAQVLALDGRLLALGRDFNAEGRLSGSREVLVLDEAAATKLATDLSGRTARVSGVEEKEYGSAPKPPFTTSTLQQEAGRKLGMPAKRAMQSAQRLYEGGYITYMRTDSIKLSEQAVKAARSLVAERYGKEYLPASPREWEGKSRNAQEAHEAIRPAGETFRTPEEIAAEVDAGDARLYELIWKRTIASQMLDARHKSVVASLDCALPGGRAAELQARGRVVLFDGFLRAYVEGSDEDSAGSDKEGGGGAEQAGEREAVLPPLRAGMDTRVAEALPAGHETKPPARYTEAGIVQKLEELGIGRPSTYASIIGTIIDREYVVKRGSALVPTPLAFAVVQLMLELEPTLVDFSFTADMEARLDSIALGELERTSFLDSFYRGKQPGLHAIVNDHAPKIDPKKVGTIPIGMHEGQAISLRVGRYGPYLESGEARASVPEGLAPDEITVEKALDLLAAAGKAEEPLGLAADGTRVFLRTGRFGPYVQLGEDPEDKAQKPKRASLFKSMDPRRLTLEEALLLLSLPRALGTAPDGGAIIARPGRFGPYLEKTLEGPEKPSKPETRSLKSEEQLLAITLEEAVALFAIPKGTRGRGSAPTLRDLGVDPKDASAILLKDGRYGPYVTDGTTNASLPKGASLDELTLEEALRLLAERREAAPAQGRRKPAARVARKQSAEAKPVKKAGAKVASTAKVVMSVPAAKAGTTAAKAKPAAAKPAVAKAKPKDGAAKAGIAKVGTVSAKAEIVAKKVKASPATKAKDAVPAKAAAPRLVKKATDARAKSTTGLTEKKVAAAGVLSSKGQSRAIARKK